MQVAEQHAFKTGDRVVFNSGGPSMTVIDTGRHTGQVWCRWMNDSGSITEAAFPPQGLDLIPANEPLPPRCG